MISYGSNNFCAENALKYKNIMQNLHSGNEDNALLQ